MNEDDNEFFVLVLGVLAAIILVISWWFTTGGTATPVPAFDVDGGAAHGNDLDDESHADDPDDDGDHDEGDVAVDDDHDEDSDDDDGDHEGDDDDHDEDADDEDAAATAGDDENAEADGPDAATETVAAPAASVFDAVAGNEDLAVVTGLLRDAGLDRVLATGGPYTMFAPSNDAINNAASSDTTVVLLESAQEEVLTYHVVPGTYTTQDLTDIAQGTRSPQLTTLQGEQITLSLDGENLLINGNAAIAASALASENGVVYTLDNVLVPPVAALNTLVGQEPILFATGSATIEDASFPTLDRFIEVLSNSDANVTIEGHTDSSGDPILNQNLSQSRARSVLNYLVANGIEESRLSAVGFGPSRPVADNDTEEGRALNRRIEFTLS